ncbi:MAG TPA: hypothetical protein VEH57_00130 [Thermoplasmata archaeon]|nr:hypothetical protein [Thermoplasmata archaeon]
MRTGLIVVGIGVALIGAGVVSSVALLPTSERVRQAWPSIEIVIGTNQSMARAFPVATAGGASEQFELDWASTKSVSVSVYPAFACGAPLGACTNASTPSVVNWLLNSSGHWVAPGPLPEYYLVEAWNADPVAVNITYKAVETYSAPWAPLPSWATFSILLGGVVLLGIGGIATFLGLFLRPSVYDPNGPISPLEPEDLDEDKELEDEPPEEPET